PHTLSVWLSAWYRSKSATHLGSRWLDQRGLEMVAMGCRSLGYAVVTSGSGHWASLWASSISLSPDCVTGLRGGLELGRALALRTGVAHDCDDLWVLICLFLVCSWF
ncbi:hypothetical protein FCV25MIE_11005, partial [Fagus crenata]